MDDTAASTSLIFASVRNKGSRWFVFRWAALVMKALSALVVAVCLAATGQVRAQPTQYAPEQIDQLLAPIALYPDPLIALILPASTDFRDIALASQYLAANGDPSAIDSQPWDPSVKGLAHYPDVVKWMDGNPDWTHALGAAFAMQPADVMKSVQQLRAKARAAGTLVNTPQQQVDTEGDNIRIVPAQADAIYVPEYDPDVVYESDDGPGPFVTFSAGFPVGVWLGYECNWDDFGIWIAPWHPGWAYRRDWLHPGAGSARWRVDPRRGHELVRNYFRPERTAAAPRFGASVSGAARAPNPGSRPAAAPAPFRPDYRGYSGAPRPSTPAPAGPVFGGYDRGTQARDYSNRGYTSRQEPVRRLPPTRSAPERRESPAPGRDRH
jgi:Protein of unknown function (DUF3300)